MTSKSDNNTSDSDRGPRDSDHEVSHKRTIKSLDEIIDESQGMDVAEAEELWDATGGCSCHVRAPCGFCEQYDWENDPLDRL